MEEDQYGMPDLRHYIPSRPLFPPPPELLPTHRPALPYDMLIFRPDSANAAAASSSAAAAGGCLFETGGDGGTGRWPRQETLTLLEIRSRLDPKFKEANQKGPLWDEVSRIMSEEHGYQRSGKKCREKFENLYKYYKKTKEGKAGRQDGKHYRFFRQLEALYGEPNTHNPVPILSENHSFHSKFHNQTPRNEELIIPGDTSLSLSNYSDADTSSSDSSECHDEGKTKKLKKLGWKIKIKDFIDVQMKKLMDKQEAWMEKMMRTIEEKERERMMREEEWRKQDSERIEREHRFWASERAWIEARDASLMEALQKLTGGENRNEIWPEGEINRLVQLRTTAEGRFQERGGAAAAEEVLWEEIAAKMACFGHERSGISCREKWDSVNNYLLKCNKKRKEDSKSCTYFEPSNQGGGAIYCEAGEPDRSVVRSPAANAMTENCFRYFMGDGYGRIME